MCTRSIQLEVVEIVFTKIFSVVKSISDQCTVVGNLFKVSLTRGLKVLFRVRRLPLSAVLIM